MIDDTCNEAKTPGRTWLLNRDRWFALYTVLFLIIFLLPLRDLMTMSWNSAYYTYIPFIPFLSVYVLDESTDCERLINAHTDPALVFAAMFQMRTDPHYQKIRHLVKSGELGELARVSWIITDWFRPESYYASGGWRATWKGEGGGVLLNQCPHNLDQIQWIFGLPERVHGYCGLGWWHNIEVEAHVTAYLEYPGKQTMVFIASTGEAPGTNRLEIAGDRGKLVFEDGRLTFTRNETPGSGGAAEIAVHAQRC